MMIHRFLLLPLLCLFLVVGANAGVGGRFLKSGKGVVTDGDTGLQWYAAPDESIGWSAARSWADRLAVDGGGWRMPTTSELSTLHAIGDGVQNLVPVFANSGYWFWAAEKPDAKWLFGFSYGGEGWSGEPPPNGGRAMAVR